jgi:hypothetical protein
VTSTADTGTPYHPVGIAMLIEQAILRGRSLARFQCGMRGNLGPALAAGTTAALVEGVGLARGLPGAGHDVCRRPAYAQGKQARTAE